MRHRHLIRLALLVVPVLVGAGCTMKSQDAPPLAGPSEFGTSITVSPSPDILTQDGASQAVVTITARDGNAQPVRSLSLRVETAVSGVSMDFGSLSSRNVVTGADGRATVVYTAPPAPSVAVGETRVEIWVFPVGTDFNNTAPRTAAIRLVPPGVVLPPDGMQPAFTFTPESPTDNQTVLFDASSSTSNPSNPIVSYSWRFGDGRTASGRTVTHSYATAGTYAVTLTVADTFGRQASVTRSINVGGGINPTAAFVISPTAPLPGQAVHFNGATSRPAPGRFIVRYQWSFGDGSSAAGEQVSHVYSTAGTYTVVLTVTDDAGRTGTTSQTVSVGTGGATASFVFSPSNPTVGTAVNFNASASTVAPGRTIVSYSWDFGDGTFGSGAITSKAYGSAGSYNVTLVIRDNQGQTATVTRAVVVM